MLKFLSSKRDLVVDLIVLGLIALFFLSYFDPRLLFLKTTINGGDTGSHYYSAQYLKEVLLPQGKIMGWLPANYAGFPLFYHYFPLPFLLAALLGGLIPLQIAFKLITVLGTFLLPFCVYLMFRLLKYEYPAPILGALFSLAFLFNERNSMWGGNIPSTLAGEFSFSLSLAVMVVFLGTLYRGLTEKKHLVINAFLFFLMGFSHGYTTMYFVLLSSFFLFGKDWLKNLGYLLRVYALGGMFLAFWFLPFIVNLPWVVPFHIIWHFGSIWEVLPPVLTPFFVLSLLTLLLNFRGRRTIFFAFAMLQISTGSFSGSGKTMTRSLFT